MENTSWFPVPVQGPLCTLHRIPLLLAVQHAAGANEPVSRCTVSTGPDGKEGTT